MPVVDGRAAPGEVRVWRAELDSFASARARLAGVLSTDERERAERFRAPADRERYVVAHGLLRVLLGRCLEDDPARLRFRSGAHGKPALEAEWESAGIRFNISHSGGLALIALARGADVGIDVERVQAGRGEMAIAERFFAPEEVAALRALPEARRRAAFYACWTRKEAIIKGLGDGLTCRLDTFRVSVDPEQRTGLLLAADDPRLAGGWSLRSLEAGAGYAAALAARGGGPAVRVNSLRASDV